MAAMKVPVYTKLDSKLVKIKNGGILEVAESESDSMIEPKEMKLLAIVEEDNQ